MRDSIERTIVLWPRHQVSKRTGKIDYRLVERVDVLTGGYVIPDGLCNKMDNLSDRIFEETDAQCD
jgi:hypothetical protein